jgi:hypothetical protein
MANNPAPTPHELRHKAAQATRLADSTLDAQAKANLLAYAQELVAQAADLEAASCGVAPTGATTQGKTAAGSPASSSTSAADEAVSRRGEDPKD